MVIEKKYHKVAEIKKNLRKLLVIQAVYYGCFIVWNCGVPMLEGKQPAPVAAAMPLVGFLAMLLGRKGLGVGNERSNSTALLGYAALSFVGTLLAIGNAFIMQTLVHYADSYPARFGKHFDVSQAALITAVAQILEGLIHATGIMMQGAGTYLGMNLKAASQSKRATA
jgi:hypothetical protein